MDSLWRVHWSFHDRAGCGSPMSRAQAPAAAARSNAIDPATARWAAPIPEQEAALMRRWGLIDSLHLHGWACFPLSQTQHAGADLPCLRPGHFRLRSPAIGGMVAARRAPAFARGP